jgi:hypothetical protein
MIRQVAPLALLFAACSSRGAWVPYQFKGDERFELAVKGVDNGVPGEGSYTVEMFPLDKGYSVTISGRYAGASGTRTENASSSKEFIEKVMAPLIQAPWGRKLFVSLAAAQFIGADGRLKDLRDGRKWEGQNGLGQAATIDVAGGCEGGGLSGRKIVAKAEGSDAIEACVSPGVGLPIWIVGKNLELHLTRFGRPDAG